MYIYILIIDVHRLICTSCMYVCMYVYIYIYIHTAYNIVYMYTSNTCVHITCVHNISR